MPASVDFTITFDPPDEQGWIVARVLEVPGALSQGRTREEARENLLDALRTVLTPDERLGRLDVRIDSAREVLAETPVDDGFLDDVAELRDREEAVEQPWPEP